MRSPILPYEAPKYANIRNQLYHQTNMILGNNLSLQKAWLYDSYIQSTMSILKFFRRKIRVFEGREQKKKDIKGMQMMWFIQDFKAEPQMACFNFHCKFLGETQLYVSSTQDVPHLLIPVSLILSLTQTHTHIHTHMHAHALTGELQGF